MSTAGSLTRRLAEEICTAYSLTAAYDEDEEFVFFRCHDIDIDAATLNWAAARPDVVYMNDRTAYDLQTKSGYADAKESVELALQEDSLICYLRTGREDTLYRLARAAVARLPPALQVPDDDDQLAWAAHQLAVLEADTLAAPTADTLTAIGSHFAELQTSEK